MLRSFSPFSPFWLIFLQIIQLIERFYDVSSGSIKIDGTNVKDFDLKWYRTRIGLVSQEPILFSGKRHDV